MFRVRSSNIFAFFLPSFCVTTAAYGQSAQQGVAVVVSPLTILVFCGVMGAVGQLSRVAVGLKTMTDSAHAQRLGAWDLFSLARLLSSIVIGFTAGFLAGLAQWKIGGIASIEANSFDTMIKFAVAGYIGTDIIEAYTAKFFDKTALADSGSSKPDAEQAQESRSSDVKASPDVKTLSTKIDAMSNQMTDMHGTLNTLATARPGGDIPGTNYPSWALIRDIRTARAKYLDHIHESAAAHGLPISLVLAIGSKESAWGLSLKPPGQGPAGTGDFTPRDPAKWGVAMPPDGLGWGRGLMQIDWYSNEFAKTGDWRDAGANISYGCGLLAGKIKKFVDAGKDEDTAIRCGVSAYNGMSGPHSSYANDVMARAAWIHAQGLDAVPPEVAVA